MKSVILLCALLTIWPFSSGQTFQLTASSSVPAASGTVQVQAGNNGNTQLDIKVKHLALPSHLSPPAGVYIVWVQLSGEPAHKLGAIQLDGNQNGELKAITTATNADVLITPEQSVNVAAPTTPPVLHAHITLK